RPHEPDEREDDEDRDGVRAPRERGLERDRPDERRREDVERDGAVEHRRAALGAHDRERRPDREKQSARHDDDEVHGVGHASAASRAGSTWYSPAARSSSFDASARSTRAS